MTSRLTLPAHLLEALRAKAGASVEPVQALKSSLFPEQLAFVEDPSPQKGALCSRRAGKSHAINTWLYEGAALEPNGLSVYIGLSRAHARRVAWQGFVKLNRRFHLGLRFREQDGQLNVVHPNGHVIWLAGCGDASEVEKFRGATDGFCRVAIDEAQAFGSYLQELVEDAIEPALLDRNGKLALTGTPGPICAGYFHAVTTGENIELPAWPTHHWTVHQNRSIPHAREWLDARRARYRWGDDHPTYLREWCGIWVNDAGALVYPLSRALNLLEQHEAPPEQSEPGWMYALGVDLGFRDATAFVLVATYRGSGRICVLEAEKREGMLPQAIGARIAQYRERLAREGRKLSAVVVDEGGLGKGYAEQFRNDGIQCEAAEKTTKRAAQDWLRGLCLAGSVKVDWTRARSLVDECAVLCWDDEGKAEDERFANHCSDAFLYASRKLGAHYRPEEESPKAGTPEAALAIQKGWRDKAVREIAKRQRREKTSQLIQRLANR